MYPKIFLTVLVIFFRWQLFAQKQIKQEGYPNSIKAVGIIKGLSDSALLEVVQRQTFRFFWHYAHPVSGLARERSNTVRAQYYWDFINEADNEPNLSKDPFGPEDCAIGGTGMGILSTIVAVNRGWIAGIRR